jgi:magnesium transporter
MIRSMAMMADGKLVLDLPLDSLNNPDVQWFWVDFDQSSEEETRLLDSQFHFHPLAVEDCLHLLQRPKIDTYGEVHFFVTHGIQADSMKAEEINLFLGPHCLVSFHLSHSREVEEAWTEMAMLQSGADRDYVYAAYLILDKLVDSYFPVLYGLEDQLDTIEDSEKEESINRLLERIYSIRTDLLRLRKSVIPMKEMMYRLVSTDKIHGVKQHMAYFLDIYDHLLKLSEMLESNREMTADLRDSYNSMYANRMNTIMKTLTVITTIFMPLSFLAGIYGMNFVSMPELEWKWGYFAILGVMAAIGTGMFVWFWRKGWFD